MKTYEKYLIKLFLTKFTIIFLIFYSLVFILSIFDEISYFKDINSTSYYPFIMTFLNTPSTIFEIFPFIFLISTQFFFSELINKNELEVLKFNGLSNLKVLKILFISSFIMGIFLIVFYYAFSSKLKFIYLDMKNQYSNDNKYLAVVTENGLWMRDEIDKKIYLVNAKQIKDQYLETTSITEFNSQFEFIRLILAARIDISNEKWLIIKPKVLEKNLTSKKLDNFILKTHFSKKKINTLFSNLSSLGIPRLFQLRNDYNNLGYTTDDINSHLGRLLAFPFYVSIMTILSSVIMLNIKRNKSKIFHTILGVLISVLIYYIYYLFNLLGVSGKIPLVHSITLPLLMLTISILIPLIRINEK
jgi:lipopolysaccharide export system permease protein